MSTWEEGGEGSFEIGCPGGDHPLQAFTVFFCQHLVRGAGSNLGKNELHGTYKKVNKMGRVGKKEGGSIHKKGGVRHF